MRGRLEREDHADIVFDEGERVRLPESARRRLLEVVQALAAGQDVAVIAHDKLLTTQQVADMLRVSRPHVVKLIDTGQIPHEMAGTHRRVRAADVLTFRERRAAERREKLRELSQASQDLAGGYR